MTFIYEGSHFIYAGKASQNLKLLIASVGDADYRYSGGSSFNLTTDKSPRSLKHQLLDCTPGDQLQFDVEFLFWDHNTAINVHPAIFTSTKTWMCGQTRFEPFLIQHPEIRNNHYNCKFNDSEDILINGYNGFKATAICDSGGAWRTAKPTLYDVTGGKTILYRNDSQNFDYTFPTIEFTLAGNTTDFSITNLSDKGRVTAFTGLYGGETITIKDTGEIISSTGIPRVSNFNKKFLRLVYGLNKLVCSSGAVSLKIESENFVRIGGG